MEYSKNTKYVIMQYSWAGLGRHFWNQLINRQCGKHSTAPESINFVKNWNRKYAKQKQKKRLEGLGNTLLYSEQHGEYSGAIEICSFVNKAI